MTSRWPLVLAALCVALSVLGGRPALCVDIDEVGREHQALEVRAVDLQHREVRQRILADDGRHDLPAVIEIDAPRSGQ